jgi:protein gp37
MCSRGLPGLKSPRTGEDFAVKTAAGPRWAGHVGLIDDALSLPLRWRKPRRIFVNSMSDTFHEAVPDEWIDRVFAVMALCPQHTFIVCTKRSYRARLYMTNQPGLVRGIKWAELAMTAGPRRVLWKCHDVAGPDRYFFGFEPRPGDDIRHWPGRGGMLPNVILLASVEDQQRAAARIPDLLATPAAVRGISLEPMLGRVDLRPYLGCQHQPKDGGGDIVCNVCCHAEANPAALQWVIVGGESGPGARPCDVEWIRDVVMQCKAAGVPCFVKQVQVYRCRRCGSCFEEPQDFGHEGCGSDDPTHDVLPYLSKNPAEWRKDLRVQQWPGVARG